MPWFPEDTTSYSHQFIANQPIPKGTSPLAHTTSPKTITGVLRCMKDRADNIRGPETKAQELHHLEDLCQANGFPATLVKKTLSAPPKVPRPPPSPTQSPQKTLCTPYVRGVSEKLKRICTRLNIRTVLTPAHTLKRTLMSEEPGTG